MATLTTIPTQDGTEYIRVLLTMGAGTPSGASLNIVASQSYVTQTGDAQFYDSGSSLILNGIQPHEPGSGTGAVRLRNTGGSFASWRNAQLEAPRMKYASSADGDTVRQGTQGNVGGGYYNWHIAGLPSDAQVGVGDTINLVIYVPPAPLLDAHNRAAAFTMGAPGFSAVVGKAAITAHDIEPSFTLGVPGFAALVGKTEPQVHDSAASFVLGAPAFSAVLGKFDVSLYDVVAGFDLGVPTFGVALGKTTLAEHDRAAGFDLGVPSFAAVLGKDTVDRSAAFTTGAPSFSAVLGKRTIAEHASSALFTLGIPSFSAVLIREDATTRDREASFVLGNPVFSAALDTITVPAIDIAATFALGGIPSFSVVLAKRIPADRTGPVADALTNGIAILKSTLLAGGLLRSVEWRQRTGQRDVRGRQSVTTSLLDVLIEDKPSLDRDRIDTDRADNTVLTVLEPLAITDSDTFQFGGHTYKVKKIDGVMKNESTGVRFSSEVVVVR